MKTKENPYRNQLPVYAVMPEGGIVEDAIAPPTAPQIKALIAAGLIATLGSFALGVGVYKQAVLQGQIEAAEVRGYQAGEKAANAAAKEKRRADLAAIESCIKGIYGKRN